MIELPRTKGRCPAALLMRYTKWNYSLTHIQSCINIICHPRMHFDAVSLHVRSISVSNISEQLCDSVIDSIDMLLIKAQMSPGLYI